jgi:hypothetical protein
MKLESASLKAVSMSSARLEKALVTTIHLFICKKPQVFCI